MPFILVNNFIVKLQSDHQTYIIPYEHFIFRWFNENRYNILLFVGLTLIRVTFCTAPVVPIDPTRVSP